MTLKMVPIPSWNSHGLLPAIDKNIPTSPERSPYLVSLKDIVMRFSTSPERRAILTGFLQYRAELHRIGIVNGFQWLDGSFLENIENIDQRAPNDIDVVTFFGQTANLNLSTDDEKLFDSTHAKLIYKVDAYIVEFDDLSPREMALWSTYWYSMWSHRRTEIWKGFLEVGLNPTEDTEAQAWLAQSDQWKD
jgi:hypothetical protein